jgi:quercetin dioxygenase-like cupin family protein
MKATHMVRVMGAAGAVAMIAASGLVLQVAQAQKPAQPPGINRIDLQRHDLSVAGREVVQTIVEIEPGVTSSRHTHPGEEIVYVLEGAPLQYDVEGKPPVTLKPGDVLFIPAGTVHSAKNVGSRKGAELATYIVEKGKPLLTEVTK